MGRFRFLEDMVLSDAAIDLEGNDLHDLFATAALALADLMVDPAPARPRSAPRSGR